MLCSQRNPLSPREHFDFAVNLMGLPEREIVISDTRSHWCLFECLSNDVRISNLAFEVQFVRSVIMIKKGFVHLDHGRLTASGTPLPSAIQVYEEASLIATDCEFTGFNVAIECFGHASVKLDKCIFRANNICLKVFNSALVTFYRLILSSFCISVPFVSGLYRISARDTRLRYGREQSCTDSARTIRAY